MLIFQQILPFFTYSRRPTQGPQLIETVYSGAKIMTGMDHKKSGKSLGRLIFLNHFLQESDWSEHFFEPLNTGRQFKCCCNWFDARESMRPGALPFFCILCFCFVLICLFVDFLSPSSPRSDHHQYISKRKVCEN